MPSPDSYPASAANSSTSGRKQISTPNYSYSEIYWPKRKGHKPSKHRNTSSKQNQRRRGFTWGF
jgi:hypothetical protein